jgi:hypothetical protein
MWGKKKFLFLYSLIVKGCWFNFRHVCLMVLIDGHDSLFFILIVESIHIDPFPFNFRCQRLMV